MCNAIQNMIFRSKNKKKEIKKERREREKMKKKKRLPCKIQMCLLERVCRSTWTGYMNMAASAVSGKQRDDDVRVISQL